MCQVSKGDVPHCAQTEGKGSVHLKDFELSFEKWKELTEQTEPMGFIAVGPAVPRTAVQKATELGSSVV